MSSVPPTVRPAPAARRGIALSVWLVLLVAASVVPLLALHLGGLYLGYRTEREAITRRGQDLARSLAHAVQGEVTMRLAVLEVLALSNALRQNDLARFRIQAEAVLASQLPGANILLVREDGQQLMNTAVPEGLPLPRRVDLENQRVVLATGRPSASNLYFGVVVRRPVVALEVPVRGPTGEIIGLLALNPTVDAFTALIRNQRPAGNWRVRLTDRRGMVLAQMPEIAGEAAVHAPVAGGEEGMAEITAPDGVSTLEAFAQVPGVGWVVAVSVPLTEVTGPALRSGLLALALGSAMLLCGLVMALAVGRHITGPIAQLRRQIALPDGEIPPVPALTGLREVDEVARAMAVAAERRRNALAALHESERRLRMVVAELNHRAKNALATVQALAQQTARGEAAADPARFTAVFNARLQTLARAHDLMSAFSWEAAALDAVVRAGLAPWLSHGDGAPAGVEVDCACGDSLPPASPGQAQAIVLALHELATNATKHGALSCPGGRVRVTCRAAPGEDSGSIIDWRETGGPPVAGPPRRRGFGIRLLERALAYDLGPGGSVVLEFDPAGVRATIRFMARPPALAA